MKLKGELDSIGLAELFKTLGDQRATGVLTLSNPNGQKIIAIADGEIAVISDKLAERSRLGDLLIARGRLTDQQLAEALRIQRTNEPRTRLGDLLVKHGMIRPQDISDSLKFQMEEEIYDLFTWKNASFDFDGERGVDEVVDSSGFDNNVQRVSLNPQQLIAEATRRMEEWKAIEARLPSPYLCFKLTPKGEELSSKGTQATQQILKLLKEGRTIETTVKKSCLGRFNVCKALVKLLDDGWIFPYPSSELRLLAAEHRSHNRFSDALHIYRRILEGLPTDGEREELQELIDETIESIRRAQESGESVEGVETVSYKEAADRFKRRQRTKRMAAMLLLGLSAIGGAYYISVQLTPPTTIAEDYRKALNEVQEAERHKRFTKAISIWQEFLSKLPDPGSPTGKLVQEQIDTLPLRHHEYLETLLLPLEAMEKNDQLDPAETGLKKMLEQYAESPLAPRMRAALDSIAAKRKKIRDKEELDKLEAVARDAQIKLKNKQYSAVKPVFTRILDLAPDGSKEKTAAQAALKELDEVEARSKGHLQKAEEVFGARKAEASIEHFRKATEEWPELPYAVTASSRIAQINEKLGKLTADISRARNLAASGGSLEALTILRQIQKDYQEYELTKSVQKDIDELDAKLTDADQAIAHAKKSYALDKNAGRQIYKTVLRIHGPIMAQREIKVPVNIITFPPGAQVKINGTAVGVTPLDTELTAGKPLDFEYRMEGYETLTNRVDRLTPDDLDTQVRLKRAPVADIPFKPGLRSAPRIVGGKMFALHGTSITVLEPLGQRTVFKTPDKLFDDTATTKPSASGTGPVDFVGDKSWWWPHVPVEPITNDRLLLPLRTREILLIDVAKQTATPLAKIPGEPVGRLFVEPVSILNGKPFFAVGTADGKVRSYEIDKLNAPKWEKVVDSKGLATGLASRGKGTFMALGANGRLVSFNVVTGDELQNLDLKAALAAGNTLPENPQESTAAVVHTDGKITAIDLLKFQVLWDLSFGRGLEEASYAITGGGGVFLINRTGEVKRYARERVNGKPNLNWTRPTTGEAAIPMHLGKYLYAAVKIRDRDRDVYGIYAFDPADGRSMWDIRIDLAPVELYESGGHLYIATQEGRLIIMKID